MDIDKSHMLTFIDGLPDQIEIGLALAGKTNFSGKFHSLTCCGMGGSGIALDVLKSVVKDIPVFVVKDYVLPSTTNKQTLVIISSYSGNTEEMLSCYKEARKRKLKVLGISSNGKLREAFEKDKVPFILVPEGYPPRASLGIQFFAIVQFLIKNKISDIKQKDIDETKKILKSHNFSREAFIVSKSLQNKTPIIYTSPELSSVGYRFKCQCNENAKQQAFCGVFSEMNHNELESYSRPNNKFGVVLVRDENDEMQLQKRMELFKKMIIKNVGVIEITPKGKSTMARIFSTMLVLDYVSYYLALMNRVDPTPVEFIEEFKQKLATKDIQVGKAQKKYKEVGPQYKYY